MMQTLEERLKLIRLLILDVDGVLTDGSIVYADSGEEWKRFHVRDGSGIKVWLASGRQLAILSGRTSASVNRRAAELGIEMIHQGSRDKLASLSAILAETRLKQHQVAAIGDDLQDMPLLASIGVSIAVADACEEVRMMVDKVTTTAGGHGAVREAIEWILKTNNEWATLIAPPAQPAG